MDNLVFEESLNTEIETSEFINKKWIYVNDNNSQNYTSQIVIDSTPLSNAGGWINWSEGYLAIPIVVQLTGSEANLPLNTNDGDYSWAIKSGFWHIINSMTVEFNNQNIIQQTPMINVFRSFKCNTSWSKDDLFNHGPSAGFCPDNAGSWSYKVGNANDSLNTNGVNVGIANNRNAPVMTAFSPVVGTNITTNTPLYVQNGVAGRVLAGGILADGAVNPNTSFGGNQYAFNDGFATRQTWLGYDPVNNTTGQGLVNDNATCTQVYRAVKQGGLPAGNVAWSVVAKLRLKDLADYFDKCPLLKGSTIRFYINTNQSLIDFSIGLGTADATTGVVGTYRTLTINSSTVIGGLTQPLMLASVGLNQGCGSLPNGDYKISLSILKNTNQSQGSANLASCGMLQSCRLYAPVYTMSPIAESRYLSLAPTRRILYNDVFQYQFSGLNPGAPFNFLVTNGINNIKSVLVFPIVSQAQTGATLATSSLYNPCSACPAMPDPITLTNFNILVSGVNLFLNNELYDFEAFQQQLMSSNQLNGNLTTGLTSGLVNEETFSRGYRYYYGNCSRTLPSEMNVSRSIQIQGQNASKVICDLIVFVEFQRSMTIDIATGARIE